MQIYFGNNPLHKVAMWYQADKIMHLLHFPTNELKSSADCKSAVESPQNLSQMSDLQAIKSSFKNQGESTLPPCCMLKSLDTKSLHTGTE